jgi:hypothetical protein
LESGGWSEYLAWTQAIAAVVFAPDNAGRPVYLDLEDSALEAVWGRTGRNGSSARSRLADVVGHTLDLATGDVLRHHRVRLNLWETTGRRAEPPSLALLAALSLAAESMTAGDGMASTNYYGRLAQLLSIVDRAASRRLEGAYRELAERLWRSLNDWLEIEHGDRGLPTAYSVGGNRHVGLPLSQALIRAADRRDLLLFFERTGLSPGEAISSEEMVGVLDAWLSNPAAGASANLRRLWARGDETMRERLAEIALIELEAWTGPREATEQTDGAAVGASRLLALAQTFLRRRLELGIEFRILEGPTPSMIELGAGGDAVTRPVSPAGGSWVRVDGLGGLPPAAMLSASLRIATAGRTLASHRPRALIVFARDDSTALYVERERAVLGVDLLVLMAERLADAVIDAVDAVARPGYQVLHAGDLDGIPEGWSALVGLQLMASPGSFDDRRFDRELNALLPVALSQIAVADGLRIPGHIRRWSGMAPPEIRVTTGAGGSLSVSVQRLGEPETLVGDSAHEGRALIVPLMGRDLPDGDYEIVVSRNGGNVIARHLLRLRSANRGESVGADELASRLFGAAGTYGADVDLDDAASGQPVDAFAAHRIPAWLNRGTSAPEARDAEATIGFTAMPCVLTGAHYLDLDEVGERQRTASIAGRCRHCGFVRRFPPTWAAIRSQLRDQQQRTAERVVAALPPLPPFSPRPATVGDLSSRSAAALDALFFLGQGNASDFDAIASQVDASALFRHRLLHALEDQSHIDVGRDDDLSPTQWRARRPSLIEVEPGEYVFVGGFGREAIERLEAAAAARGGELRREVVELGLPRWSVVGVDATSIHEIGHAATGPRGEAVAVDRFAAAELARGLPRLSDIVRQLAARRLPPYRALQRFDVRGARWLDVPRVSEPGGYRLEGYRVSYVFRLPDTPLDLAVVADARLVRHVAALIDRDPLVAYHSTTRVLEVPMGADLPSLFARAAVLTSGWLPSPSRDRASIGYRDVPPAVAATIIAKLES